MRRMDIDRQERPAIARSAIAVMMLAAAVTSGIASASDNVDGRAGAARKIVVWDDDRISPAALMMDRGEVLEFENDSGEFMRLVFVEPQGQSEKIRCQLLDHTIARPDQAPWLRFDWGPGRRLTAVIPPGKFASACRLAPGQYTFVTTRVSRDPRAVVDPLGTKGTITVQ